MIQATEDREIIAIPCSGSLVAGTYHRPGNEGLPADPAGRVGVIFISSLFPTRAANGDTAVFWAKGLAKLGYPAFRVDVPGFGDSEGDPPPDLLAYFNSGGYAAATCAIARQLVERYRLSGVIFAGHCAGAVSSLFSAGQSADCRGIILMNPYFHLPPRARSAARDRLSDWALQSRLGETLSNFYDLCKEMRLRLLRNALPAESNFALIHHWKKVASKGMPILIIKGADRKAKGGDRRTGEFDFLRYALRHAGARRQVWVRSTEGADHSFANRPGRNGTRDHIAQWMSEYFPLMPVRSSVRVAAAIDNSDVQQSWKLEKSLIDTLGT